MELRPGYKQTEVGVIPDNWNVDSFLRISRQIMDYRGRTPKKLGMEWGGGEIPALSAGNVKMGCIDFNAECYLASDALYKRWMTKGYPGKDDILFTTEAPLGNVALVPDSRKYILSQRTILLQLDKERAESRFVFQVMLSDRFQRMLADYSSGSTAKGIQRKKFEQLCVALPPTVEQRAIATALSDVDALLDGLDCLIAKKRDIKKAAMQQLLSGQARLPGFKEPWQEAQVQDVIVSYFSGPSPTCEERNVDGDAEWGVLKTTAATKDKGWNWKAHKVLPKSFWGNHKAELKAGDVIVTKAGPRHRVGVPAWVDYIPPSIIVSGKMIGLRPDSEKIHPMMLASAISSPQAQTYLDQRTTGMAESQVNFENGNLLETPITFPSFEEQLAIASLLQDMDTEIAVLEKRRAKTRDLKQAMMKELLTGRTRLV